MEWCEGWDINHREWFAFKVKTVILPINKTKTRQLFSHVAANEN